MTPAHPVEAVRVEFEKWWNGDEPPYVELRSVNALDAPHAYAWAGWQAALATLAARCEKMEGALRFYADKGTYDRNGGHFLGELIDTDQGAKARATLPPPGAP